jgi:D-3-phosphoglycerate dehydrogenase
MKVALNPSRINRVDLFEAADLEIIEARVKTEDDMIELMADADGAQVGVWPLTSRRVLENCPKLKVVSRFGVGVDSIDLDAATELGGARV